METRYAQRVGHGWRELLASLIRLFFGKLFGRRATIARILNQI